MKQTYLANIQVYWNLHTVHTVLILFVSISGLSETLFFIKNSQ